MAKCLRILPSSAAVLLALALAFCLPMTALADDSAPPQEETAPQPAEETSPPAGGASESQAAPLSEAINLVVLDEGGQSVALATEEAAAILDTADPIWCPAGIVPIALTGGCSDTYGDLTSLISLFVPTGNGVIWIEGGAEDSAGDIEIDGAGGWSAANAFSLTLRGGWSGTFSSTAIDTTNPSVINPGSLTIVNWIGAVTLSDIRITGATNNPNGAVADGTEPALYIQTSGNIVLTRVESSENQGGADEMSGAYLSHTGPGTVTITNAKFNHSDNFGLLILSSGSVTLKNVAAHDNDLRTGVNINNAGAATAKPVTITNLQANQNGATATSDHDGLYLISKGALTLTNITAVLNADDGAEVDNCAWGGLVCDGTGALKVLGANTFSDNGGDGLEAFSGGAIAVNNTVAHDNGGGLYLQNSGASSSQNVALIGFLSAVGNESGGLSILSRGAVTAANLTAAHNGTQGAFIDNTFAAAGASRPVTLTGVNVFSDNGFWGLQISSDGAVTVANPRAVRNGYALADDNFGTGVLIENESDPAVQQNVTLTGTSLFNGNYSTGLSIASYGAVALSNVTATGNGMGDGGDLDGFGIYIDNQGGIVMKPVTISGTSQFNFNDDAGLQVVSDGAVTLNNLTAHDNGVHGVLADNQNPDDLMPGITLTGVNSFTDNGGYGLLLSSDGVINVSKVTGTLNGNAGVFLDNSDPPAGASPGITILGYLSANQNAGEGVFATSDGAIAAASLTVNYNGGRGASFANNGAPSPKPVTITGLNNLVGNGDQGLFVVSDGAVSASNITALSNGLDADFLSGVSIENGSDPSSPQNVTLSGVNVFEDNGFQGLEISSYGTVTLSNVTAIGNGFQNPNVVGDGVRITNDAGTLARPVTLTGTNAFIDNDARGLAISSDGAIAVSNLTASYNNSTGALLDNRVSPVFQSNVTISGYGTFEFNDAYGLLVQTRGAVLTGNLTANQNGLTGVDIYTFGESAPHAVTLNGNNSFFSNGLAGLLVLADGNIKVNNLSSSNNAAMGAYLDNYTNWDGSGFATYGSVTLSGFGYFSDNSQEGLAVFTHGSATLTRIVADSNAFAGISITADGNVTLVCLSSYGNGAEGLYVHEYVADLASETLTLKGWSYYGNSPDEDIAVAFTVVRTACP